MKNNVVLVIIIVVAIICVLGVGILGGVGFIAYRQTSEAITAPVISAKPPTPSVKQPTATAPSASESEPGQSSGPASSAPLPPGNPSLATETETLLTETDVPARDLRLLAIRLRNGGDELPIFANVSPPVMNVGDQDSFWIVDNIRQPPLQFQVNATLQHISDHVYWWVEDGFIVSQRDLEQSATVFEQQTYPTTREFFGSEWSPGVDNDPHIAIFLGNVPGVGGYFASSHEFTKEVDQYSNEREMFLINLNALKPGNSAFDSVLAHEFQHMIHWHQDRNEETWINEGMSELAVLLNGFAPDRSQNSYLQQPDVQLTTWAHDIQSSAPHYGSSYLFMAYFLDQFGQETMKAVVAEQSNGVQGFNDVLARLGTGQTFDDVFADFAVANYLNNTNLAAGQWGYNDISINPVLPGDFHNRFPVSQNTIVQQYGVDYIEVESGSPVEFDFAGATVVPVLNNQAYSGRYQWYSNRGDDSNTTLTRAVDLSGVAEATLTYQAWYDIEEDWDYAYVMASTDDGKSWTVLEAPSSRSTNPTGNGYGPGYTAKSNGWLAETIDLSAYAGQEFLLRFEYITDDATNGPGFALDDVAIPEIGFFDDMETADPGWEAAGFIRMDNQLRQRFIVQIVDLVGEEPTVTRLPLDELNTGQITLGDGQTGTHAVIVISAQAPVTTEGADYRYSFMEVK